MTSFSCFRRNLIPQGFAPGNNVVRKGKPSKPTRDEISEKAFVIVRASAGALTSQFLQTRTVDCSYVLQIGKEQLSIETHWDKSRPFSRFRLPGLWLGQLYDRGNLQIIRPQCIARLIDQNHPVGAACTPNLKRTAIDTFNGWKLFQGKDISL